MDYKPKRTKCSKGCGRANRPGQRTCRECHRLAEKAARKRRRQELETLRADGVRVLLQEIAAGKVVIARRVVREEVDA